MSNTSTHHMLYINWFYNRCRPSVNDLQTLYKWVAGNSQTRCQRSTYCLRTYCKHVISENMTDRCRTSGEMIMLCIFCETIKLRYSNNNIHQAKTATVVRLAKKSTVACVGFCRQIIGRLINALVHSHVCAAVRVMFTETHIDDRRSAIDDRRSTIDCRRQHNIDYRV